MAIYHFTVKIISRGKRQSVVTSVAYRAAQLFDERLGKHHMLELLKGASYRMKLLDCIQVFSD